MRRRLESPNDKGKIEQKGLTTHTVFYARDEDPDDGSGIFYRERLLAVSPGTTRDEAGRLIQAHFEFLKELGTEKNLKLFISVQVYDHEFKEQADRPAVAALEWKQWKPKKPKIVFPLSREEGITFSMLPPPPSVNQAEPFELTEPVEAEPIELTSRIEPEVYATPAEDPIDLVDEVPQLPAKMPLGLTSEIEVSTRAKAKAAAKKQEAAEQKEKIKSSAFGLDDKMVEAFERVQEIYALKDHDIAAAFLVSLGRDLIGCEAGACMLVSPGKYELYVSAVTGGIDEKLKGKKHSLTKGVVGSAMQNSSVVRISDVLKDDRFDGETDKKDGIEIRNIMCAPVQHEGRIRGAIELINSSRQDGFSQKDADVLSYLSSVLAEHISLYLPSREADFTERDFFEHFAKAELPKKKRISLIPPIFSPMAGSSKHEAERQDTQKKKSAPKHGARGKKKKKRRN